MSKEEKRRESERERERETGGWVFTGSLWGHTHANTREKLNPTLGKSHCKQQEKRVPYTDWA